MLNYLLTSALPPFAQTNSAGPHLATQQGPLGIGRHWWGQTFCQLTCSNPTPLQFRCWEPKQLAVRSKATQAWKAAVPRAFELHKWNSLTLWPGCQLDNRSLPTILWTRTEPAPSAGQDPHWLGQDGQQENLHGHHDSLLGVSPGPSAIISLCAKLKQCVVLACCILYKTLFPFPPPNPLFKTFI